MALAPTRDESEDMVSKDAQEATPEVRDILVETRAHLEWLRDAGVEEVHADDAPRVASPFPAAGASGASARSRERPPASPSIEVGGSAPDSPAPPPAVAGGGGRDPSTSTEADRLLRFLVEW